MTVEERRLLLKATAGLDSRLDAGAHARELPDIYRSGFGILRKGGVARPR
jgi:hypothetical protein